MTMRDTNSHLSVRQVEEAFLRKAWWLFPVCGAWAALAVGGPFWAWVDGQPVAVRWADLFGLRAGLAAVLFSGIPVAWWLGLRLKRTGLWVILAVPALVAGAEGMLRTSKVQVALWQAAQGRLDPGVARALPPRCGDRARRCAQ